MHLWSSTTGAAASKLPGGEHVPPGAKRLSLHYHYNYRLAGLPLLPNATPVLAHYWF